MRTAGQNAHHLLLLVQSKNESCRIDMWSMLLLTFLILVPIVAYRVARRRLPRHAFGIAGAAYGAIVTPWAFGLYSWFFLSPLGVIPGFLGLALVTIHEPPGFYLAVHWGLVPRGEVVSGIVQHLIVEVINAFVWSIFYGSLGHGIDYVRNRRDKPGRLG